MVIGGQVLLYPCWTLAYRGVARALVQHPPLVACLERGSARALPEAPEAPEAAHPSDGEARVRQVL